MESSKWDAYHPACGTRWVEEYDYLPPIVIVCKGCGGILPVKHDQVLAVYAGDVRNSIRDGVAPATE